MSTRLSASVSGNSDMIPLNIAPGAEESYPRGQATNLSGSHRPTNNVVSQMEYFADEIVLGELQKREIMGVPITRRMSRAIVACLCLSFVVLAVILTMTFSHDGQEQQNMVTISVEEGDRRYQLFENLLEPLTGASIAKAGTPEAMALHWMAYDDPAQLDPHAHIEKVTERFVLSTLYFSTGGDTWENSIGFLSQHDVCGWNDNGDSPRGAYCNNKGNIERLVLSNLNMNGTIPIDLGLLTHLTHMDLSSNKIRDYLPSSFGLLHALSHLDVGNNKMSGFAPNNDKLTNLKVLKLENNEFEGQIPSEYFIHLPKIDTINLSNNRFTGFVSENLDEIGETASLKRLELQYNKLEGKIPLFLSRIDSLKILDLSNNEFTGSIPGEFGAMQSLTHLDLSHNKLSGSIPSTFGETSNGGSGDMTLGVFRASSNNLVGYFPIGLTKIPPLGIIALDDNGFSGAIPSEIGNMKELQILDLSNNSFGNTIPSEFGSCKMLDELNLSNNRLVERIPTHFGHLGSLNKLDIRNNFLDGSIPTQLRNLPELTSVLLSGNSFVANLDLILCNRPVSFPAWETIQADCLGSLLTCSCCTSCCNQARACCTPGSSSCDNL